MSSPDIGMLGDVLGHQLDTRRRVEVPALRELRPGARRQSAMRPVSVVLGAVILASCTPAPHDTVIEVHAVAGPVCPVETVPPNPACEPRAVAGAPIFVMPADGRDVIVAQGTTDDNGLVRLEVPPGAYTVMGGEVPGLMGQPSPASVTARSALVPITLIYDTGIR
jgi:hypothetical protein